MVVTVVATAGRRPPNVEILVLHLGVKPIKSLKHIRTPLPLPRLVGNTVDRAYLANRKAGGSHFA